MLILKKDVVVTEASIRVSTFARPLIYPFHHQSFGPRPSSIPPVPLIQESKIGLAVGKLRNHGVKEVADLAKEVVKKWKTEVDRAKAGAGHGHHHAGSSTVSAVKKDGGATVKTARMSLRFLPLSFNELNGSGFVFTAVRKDSTNGSASPATPTAANVASGSAIKGGPRSSKSDGVNVNATSDKTRDKCIELIYDALSSDSGARKSYILRTYYHI